MHRALKLLLPVALLLAATPAAAAFRCVDKAGKVSYMERPCSTYGLKTEKEVKDPPKGDGSARVVPSGQAVSRPQSGRAADGEGGRYRVQLFCDGKQIECHRGETVVCGSQRQVCDSD
jgi:hypothetical protein